MISTMDIRDTAPSADRQPNRAEGFSLRRYRLMLALLYLVSALVFLALVVVLTGCVGEWTPEESAAKTATAGAYLVPTMVRGKISRASLRKMCSRPA